jgi:hypothetical protein
MEEKVDVEKCQRCGAPEGGDLRTLWMSCFYAMDELKLPFKQYILFDADKTKLAKVKDPDVLKLNDGSEIKIGPGTLKCDGELSPRGFFTLSVCKDCRSDWMHAIQKWFNEKPEPDNVGSGIYVRDFGASREITDEEWHARNQ